MQLGENSFHDKQTSRNDEKEHSPSVRQENVCKKSFCNSLSKCRVWHSSNESSSRRKAASDMWRFRPVKVFEINCIRKVTNKTIETSYTIFV